MSSSVLGKLVSANTPNTAILAGVIVSAAFLILLTVLRLPVSLSNCTVGAFVGAALASNSSINGTFLVEIVGSWIAAPFLCALVTVITYELIAELESSRSLIKVSLINRILLVIAVFYVSFALGANNIGVIVSFAKNYVAGLDSTILLLGIFLATALGMVLFGKSIAKVVGDKIVGLSQMKTLSAMLGTAIITTIFTVVSVPVSLTQVIIGGMLGAGVAHRPSIVNNRELATLVGGWALVTIASTALGFVVARLI